MAVEVAVQLRSVNQMGKKGLIEPAVRHPPLRRPPEVVESALRRQTFNVVQRFALRNNGCAVMQRGQADGAVDDHHAARVGEQRREMLVVDIQDPAGNAVLSVAAGRAALNSRDSRDRADDA